MPDKIDYRTKAQQYRAEALHETDPLRRYIFQWVENGLLEMARQTDAYGEMLIETSKAPRRQIKRQNLV